MILLASSILFYLYIRGFALSNNNQEIRRLKLRLEQLKKDKQEPTQEYETDYFEVVENKELMRLQLIFEGVPDQKTREILFCRG